MLSGAVTGLPHWSVPTIAVFFVNGGFKARVPDEPRAADDETEKL
jgi:hypothetical protein